jgi:hypothetical protein
MKNYIYLMLTKGSDGRFSTTAHTTLESAQKTLEMYIDAQKEIEALDGNIYIDRHKFERLRLPEFTMRDDDILEHVTIHTRPVIGGKATECVTDRYIIRVAIN